MKAMAGFGVSPSQPTVATLAFRHRGKIEATIHNARLVGTGSSWPDLVWAHAPRVQPVLERWSDGRMSSPESLQLSADLKRLGYRYIGPVAAHSFMQTVGVENGHFAGCFRAEDARIGSA
jgi:DNA-3-methyladenine glycosylase I